MQNLDKTAQAAVAAFAATDNPDTLEQVKARFLGKSGQITELLKGLAKLSPEDKKSAGAAINKTKEFIETALNSRREHLRRKALESRLSEESLDVTLPGRGESKGGLHPVTRTLERIEALFRSIGFYRSCARYRFGASVLRCRLVCFSIPTRRVWPAGT